MRDLGKILSIKRKVIRL